MMRRRWESLYGKRPQVDARRSGLGCLLASAGLVGICGAIAYVGGQPLVLGKEGEADRRMALNALAEIDDALRQVLHDAGVATPTDLFQPATLEVDGSGLEAAEAQGQQLRTLLRDGAQADLELSPGVREHLAPQYLAVRNDPWGHPYLALLGPQSGPAGATAGWLLICTGPDGTLDAPDAKSGDDLTQAGPAAK